MFTKSGVLFPTDFSPYAEHAMKYAVAMARKYHGTVHVAHVLDSSLLSAGAGHGLWMSKADRERLAGSMREHAESRLAHVIQTIQREGVNAEAHISQGKPGPELIRLADLLNCDLIVIATHGRSGFDHFVFGSVCEKVVRLSRVAVLSIKHPEREFVDDSGQTVKLARILFPTDFSDMSAHALPYAVSLCRQFSAELLLLHVSEAPLLFPETMPDIAASVDEHAQQHARECLERIRAGIVGVRCERRVTAGLPHQEICRTVEDSDIDLIVMPTRGRSGFAHLLFGDVAEKVVRLAKCPVLTLRPDGLVVAADEEATKEALASRMPAQPAGI